MTRGKTLVGLSALSSLLAASLVTQLEANGVKVEAVPEPEPELDDPDIIPPRPVKPQYSGMTSQTAAFQQGQDDFNNNEPNAESSFSRPERDMYRNGWTLAKQKAKRS